VEIAAMLAQQRAIGPRRRDQDAAHAAQRHEAAAAKAMRLRVLIAARRTGTARFGNIIVRSFFEFSLSRPATRRARACGREHGGIHAIDCGACHGRQVAGGATNSRVTIFAPLG
jgi:hypothetical protein